jgi:hypothetical protein
VESGFVIVGLWEIWIWSYYCDETCEFLVVGMGFLIQKSIFVG